jgi:hypothetical protein
MRIAGNYWDYFVTVLSTVRELFREAPRTERRVPRAGGDRQETGAEGPAGKDEPEPMLNHSECIMARWRMGVKGELAQFSHPFLPWGELARTCRPPMLADARLFMFRS